MIGSPRTGFLIPTRLTVTRLASDSTKKVKGHGGPQTIRAARVLRVFSIAVKHVRKLHNFVRLFCSVLISATQLSREESDAAWDNCIWCGNWILVKRSFNFICNFK